MKITRRTFAGSAAATGLAISPAMRGWTMSDLKATSGMLAARTPSILDLLADLEGASALVNQTWRPGDPEYQAGINQQIMMNLSYAYFLYFFGNPDQPDWCPLWNPAYLHQPNPDDIYLYANIRGDRTYRVSGNRGTVALLLFNTMLGAPGMLEERPANRHGNALDCKDIEIGPDGEFEIVFSANRPAGHTGNWAPMDPEATGMMVRYRSIDWANEIDPRLSIECLDPGPPRPRLSPEEIDERIREMARYTRRISRDFQRTQNGTKERVGINAFESISFAGGGAVAEQVYWTAVFEVAEDEALIIETDMPRVRRYWNIQINDPFFNTIEYVYRIASLNEATARLSSDGRFRAVVAHRDPGVPNWLDTAGFDQGTLYGRWLECDSAPLPTIRRIPLAELRKHLPADTPVVSAAERAGEIALRVRAAQRRRRW